MWQLNHLQVDESLENPKNIPKISQKYPKRIPKYPKISQKNPKRILNESPTTVLHHRQQYRRCNNTIKSNR